MGTIKKINNIKRISLIWKFAKRYPLYFVLAELCLLVTYITALLLPLNLSYLTDNVLNNKQHDKLLNVIIIYVLLFIIAAVFNLIYAFIWQKLNSKFTLDIKNEIYDKIINSEAKHLSSIDSGDVMSRIDQDAGEFINVVQRNLFHFINSIFLCLGIIIVIASKNKLIAIICLIAAILPIALTRICGKFTEKNSKKLRENESKLTGKISEIIKGYREIKLLCAEKIASNKVFSLFQKNIPLGNKLRKGDFLVNKIVFFINLITSLVIYAFSIYLIYQNKLTLGMFLAIIEYVALLHKKFNWMLRIYLEWFNRRVSIDRVYDVLNLKQEKKNGLKINNINSIEFKNVTFMYDKKIILNKLNLKINQGDKTAITGVSGSGKTTITSLLLKLYNPTSGNIYINGIDIKNINTTCLRQLFGIVSQDVLIFEDTIKNNLCMGDNYTEKEIITSLKQSKIYDVIKALPKGINAKLSDKGFNLSQGQKQRLIIARTFLKNTNIIILDEATSALDLETEKEIINSIFNVKKDSTIIVISHRLLPVKNCSKTFVLNNEPLKIKNTSKLLNKESTFTNAVPERP